MTTTPHKISKEKQNGNVILDSLSNLCLLKLIQLDLLANKNLASCYWIKTKDKKFFFLFYKKMVQGRREQEERGEIEGVEMDESCKVGKWSIHG